MPSSPDQNEQSDLWTLDVWLLLVDSILLGIMSINYTYDVHA